MKDKKKAAEEVQRLVNTNFTGKNLKIKISYEKGVNTNEILHGRLRSSNHLWNDRGVHRNCYSIRSRMAVMTELVTPIRTGKTM